MAVCQKTVLQQEKKHPKTGVTFKPNGHADFSSYADETVEIVQTGKRKIDEAAANAKAGLDGTPDGYTWHHVEDGKTMQLVPTDIHKATGHTGGVAAVLSKVGAGLVILGTILDHVDPLTYAYSGEMEPPPGFEKGPFGLWKKIDDEKIEDDCP